MCDRPQLQRRVILRLLRLQFLQFLLLRLQSLRLRLLRLRLLQPLAGTRRQLQLRLLRQRRHLRRRCVRAMDQGEDDVEAAAALSKLKPQAAVASAEAAHLEAETTVELGEDPVMAELEQGGVRGIETTRSAEGRGKTG